MPYRTSSVTRPSTSRPPRSVPSKLKTKMLTEATHGDVVDVGGEPHAQRVSLVEEVRKEQVDCLELQALPALLRIDDRDSDFVHVARVAEGAHDRLHHAEKQISAPHPEFDAVIGPLARRRYSTFNVLDRHVLTADRPDGLAHRLDGGLGEWSQRNPRRLAHARAAANRSIAPGTPFSSTGPTSRNATGAPLDASTTSWLTTTSPAWA